MSVNNHKEGVRPASIILPLLHGVLGLIVLFAAGSRSGSSDYAILATCLWFLFGACLLSRRYPSGWLFIGATMNLPLWLFFIWAEAGQFEAYLWGIAACFGISYLGVLAGRWCSALSPPAYKRLLVLSSFATVLSMVILLQVVRQATPIPSDKRVFIGRWKSDSGFELKIESDGTARIVNNDSGRQGVRINEAPNNVEALNVSFIGDSILEVGRPSYYGKTYKIDRYPYRDSSVLVMILNGTTLKREH